MIAQNDYSNIFDGLVTDHWETMVGLNPATFGGGTTSPLDSQFQIAQISTSDGNSNYEAGYISVRKQTTHGLAWQVNYTLSRSNDNLGVNQENVFISPTDAFNKSRDYGPSAFDRRHVLNAFFIYDLPFGRGHRLSSGNFLNRVIGGWTVAGQFAAASGLPDTVYNYNSCEELGNGYGGFCAAMLPTKGLLKMSANYRSRLPLLRWSPASAGCSSATGAPVSVPYAASIGGTWTLRLPRRSTSPSASRCGSTRKQ